jgi:putative transposase
VNYVTVEGNLRRRWQMVKDFVQDTQKPDFWPDLNKHVRSLVKDALQITLDDEMSQYTQSKRHQRTKERMDYRNGYYFRDLDTGIGPIENIAVPRSRSGLFRPTCIQRYQRRQEAVNDVVRNVFLSGVSTRDVSGTLKPLLGTTISASAVSRICKSLDSAVKAFHSRELLDEYQFLLLDGVTMKVKGSLKAKKIMVLVAYGITMFGKKELLAFRLAKAESNEACEGFLQDLYNRGFKGSNLKLVITDGSKGFANAIDLVYPHARHQRCWVHKLRNIAKYLKKADQKVVLGDVKKIYKAETRRQAVELFKAFRRAWIRKYPKAVRSIEQDLDDLLAFLEIPIKKEHAEFIRRQIRTTNIIERSLREVRRRTRPMSCFNNTDSVQRIVYAVFTKLNNKWKAKPLAEFTQFI